VKFLKSQGIVLILAAVALALVGNNLVWPFLKPKFASRSAAPATATASAPAPSRTATAASKTISSPLVTATVTKLIDAMKAVQAAPPAVAKRENMNAPELKNLALAWNSSPLRDPFKRRGAISEKSAREQLTLTGILRQTDSDLAVINNAIIAVGESILGFRIEKVEPDRVWLSGPNGQESIEFKYFVQAPKPPQTPDTPEKPAENPVSAAPPEPRRPVRTRSKESRATPAGSGGLNAEERAGQSIDDAMEGGEFVRLGDYFLRQQLLDAPFDVIDSVLWFPILNITVIERDDVLSRCLINNDENEVIAADLLPD